MRAYINGKVEVFETKNGTCLTNTTLWLSRVGLDEYHNLV